MRRNKGMILVLALALTMLFAQATHASRDVWWDVEYDGTVYPDEATPVWTQVGAGVDTLLTGGYYRAIDSGNADFNWQISNLVGDVCTYEIRVKVNWLDTRDFLHAVYSRGPNETMNLGFAPGGNGVRLQNNIDSSDVYPVSTTDGYHTYRVIQLLDSSYLYVDGEFAAAAKNQETSEDYFAWGSHNDDDTSSVDWDYVRVRTDAAVYPDSLSVTGDWYKSPCNPILEADAAYPNVVDLGDSLIMYFDKYGPPQRICYATSVDGYTWVDQGTMIAPGQDGQFSWSDVSTGHVFYNQNLDEYWMYYNANDGSQWHDVGLATSPDGFSWTDHGSVLTIDGSGWDSHSLGHPKVLWVEGHSQYYMLYRGAWGSASDEGAIGLASSADGFTWMREGTGPVVTPTEPYDMTSIVYPGALFSESGEFHFYYSGVGNDGRCRVIEATSVDLASWTKQGAILEATEDWEDTHIWYATRFILNGVPTLFYQQEYGGHFGLAQSVDMGSECVASQSGQLSLPTMALNQCESECVYQPVVISCEDTISTLSIPVQIPEGVTVCEMTTDGCPTSSWLDYSMDQSVDSGFVHFALADNSGDVLEPGEHTVAYIGFAINDLICGESGVVTWDTTLMGDNFRELATVNTDGEILYPAFDASIDSSAITQRMAGDNNADCTINIGDLTAKTAYMFAGGYVVLPDMIDVNGDCLPNIADLTYLVAYLFSGGPAPVCHCSNPAPAPKINGQADLIADYANGTTILTLSSDIDLAGLEVHLRGNGSAEPVSLADANLELVHGHADGLLKIGLLDMQAVQMIKAGETRLVEISGEYEIVHALGSSLDHRPVGINLASSATPEVPHSFALHQNYPNPFNPNTTIKFESPETADYTLTVYNTLGQVVKRFEGTAQSGENEVTWDASASSSGVYFYKLEIGNNTDTKKMMLLK